MGSSARRNASFAAVGALVVTLVAACGPAGGASPGAPTGSGSPSAVAALSPGATPAPDQFAGLSYRLDLPAGWVVMGTDAYDASIDAAPDVADWLAQLDLIGTNAFRAYEPVAGAEGLRIAINPATAWNPSALQDAGIIARLPGVSEEPIGDWVPIGEMAKGSRFRWTQTLDWGSGSPSARTCVGYMVLGGPYDPVNVVISFPADTDRLAEVDALMASFEVTGNPVVSLPPGTTPTPSPTPFDKFASTEPMPRPHDAPELEALLPDSIGGVALIKESTRGDLTGMAADDPILTRFGKQPADYASAMASPNQPPLLIIQVARLDGVSAADLLAAGLELTPDAEVSKVQLGGHGVTYVSGGMLPVWYYPSGDLLYGLAGLEDQVASILALLP